MPRNDTDESGVDSRMRLFIEELAATASWQGAADVAGVNERTPRRWLSNHDGFRALFDETFGSTDKDSYKRQADILQSKALRVYDESMDAAQTVEVKVQCPECGERFTVDYVVPNQGTRLKAADSVSKITSMLKETKEHKGTITMVQLTGIEKSALIAIQAGFPVAQELVDHLVEIGAIERPALPAPQRPYIDGEAREIR